MLKLLAMASVLLILQGCQRAMAPEEKVWNVSPRSLWNTYCDNDPKWTGQRVRVQMGKKEYVTVPGEVQWHNKRQSAPPSLVFKTANPPETNDKPITVEGTVKGIVVDEFVRPMLVKWHVLIENCTATVGK